MKKILLIVLTLISYLSGFSQVDSLILNNGNVIVGELKSLDKGVAVIETDYSDKDFNIEWDGIKKLYTTTSYLVTLENGKRVNARLESSKQNTINLIEENGTINSVKPEEIVFLKSVDKGFLDRVYATIDIGFDLAKSNNLSTFSARSTAGYLANRWSLDINFNSMYSTQENADATKRTDGGLSYKFYLPHDWYIPVSISYLSNTEQRLDARYNVLAGVGKYIIHSNHAYWGVAGGASYNNEKYSPIDTSSLKTSSMEGYLGTELNLFDIGDLSLITTAKVFPGITEKGRWRADFNFDMKYDLPLDFYIKLGYSLNWDNQPVEGAEAVDYVLHTGFGWEW